MRLNRYIGGTYGSCIVHVSWSPVNVKDKEKVLQEGPL